VQRKNEEQGRSNVRRKKESVRGKVSRNEVGEERGEKRAIWEEGRQKCVTMKRIKGEKEAWKGARWGEMRKARRRVRKKGIRMVECNESDERARVKEQELT
jgi:hypothetical protein